MDGGNLAPPYSRCIGVNRDNGKESGNYHSMLGLFRDNGKHNIMRSCVALKSLWARDITIRIS